MATLFVDSDLNDVVFTIDPYLREHIDARVRALGLNKSQPCKFFQKGTCMKGDACPFKHVRGEKLVVCKHWLRGLCKKNDQCEFLHEYDLSKMPPCHFFVTFGLCSNDECPFLHLKPEDKIRDCPFYDRGFCRLGPNCKNRHVRRQICLDYLAGFCALGNTCANAHPKFESVDENFTGTRSFRGVPTCKRCNQPGHTASECSVEIPTVTVVEPLSTEDKKKRAGLRDVHAVTCFKCGERGHYANVCPNKRRPPPAGGYSLPGINIVNPFDRKRKREGEGGFDDGFPPPPFGNHPGAAGDNYGARPVMAFDE
jgi:cleavage and polyadenylation specificity factor subunit 4